ncbi:uncharacterized protein [Amphiura filiformis]
MFPADEKAVLDFLKRYTNVALKSIYLHIANRHILAHIQQTYKNLDTVSFLSASDPPREALTLDIKHPNRPHPHNHDDILPLAKTIKTCEIPLLVVGCNGCTEMHDKLSTQLGNCKNLRRLTITGMRPRYLTPGSWDALSQAITELNFLRTVISRSGYSGYEPSGLDFSSQLCTALMALLKFSKVNCFRLSIDEPFTAGTPFNIDEFLCGIADKWRNLRRLTLVGIRPPSHRIFSFVMSGLARLQTLELYGEMITDERIALIATHLRSLTSLTLTDGHYTPSGIRALCGHLSIERLYLLQDNHLDLNRLYLLQDNQLGQNRMWLLAVYDVIRSLPKIAYVKLHGYRLIALHARVEVPPISTNVQIDVENSQNYEPTID